MAQPASSLVSELAAERAVQRRAGAHVDDAFHASHVVPAGFVDSYSVANVVVDNQEGQEKGKWPEFKLLAIDREGWKPRLLGGAARMKKKNQSGHSQHTLNTSLRTAFTLQ